MNILLYTFSEIAIYYICLLSIIMRLIEYFQNLGDVACITCLINYNCLHLHVYLV